MCDTNFTAYTRQLLREMRDSDTVPNLETILFYEVCATESLNRAHALNVVDNSHSRSGGEHCPSSVPPFSSYRRMFALLVNANCRVWDLLFSLSGKYRISDSDLCIPIRWHGPVERWDSWFAHSRACWDPFHTTLCAVFLGNFMQRKPSHEGFRGVVYDPTWRTMVVPAINGLRLFSVLMRRNTRVI